MLRIEGLSVRYGAIQAVRDVSLCCPHAHLVALIGPNGAGKSSILKAIAGARAGGARVDGEIHLDDRQVHDRAPEELVRLGVALVPEGRHIFASLSVEENLLLGSGRRPGPWTPDVVLERFPALAQSKARSGGLLSGGQQQLLAIGRALVTNPDFLLCDEPSLGLAPQAIDEVFDILDQLRREGVGVLLVEQNARRAVELADSAYTLRKGEIDRLDTNGQPIDALLGHFGEASE